MFLICRGVNTRKQASRVVSYTRLLCVSQAHHRAAVTDALEAMHACRTPIQVTAAEAVVSLYTPHCACDAATAATLVWAVLLLGSWTLLVDSTGGMHRDRFVCLLQLVSAGVVFGMCRNVPSILGSSALGSVL